MSWKKTLYSHDFVADDNRFINIYKFMKNQYRVEIYENYQRIVEESFKTKSQALSFAKKYMKENP